MMLRRWAKIAIVTAHVAVPGLTNLKARGVAGYRHLLRRPRQPALRALRHIGVGAPLKVLDVGSATGQGVADIRHLRPDAEVVAFEPNPMYAAQLRRRFSSDPLVRVEQIALAEVAGAFTLFVPIYNYTALPDLGTSSRAEASHWLRGRLLGYREESLFLTEVRCRATSLDDMKLDPDVIVIDTRCDASSILRGGEETMRTGRPVVLLERADLDRPARELLRGAGYKTYRMEGRLTSACALEEPCDLAVGPAHSLSASFVHWVSRHDS